MHDVTEALLALLKGAKRGALATVVRTSGSTPQVAGARMLLAPDDCTVGTIGGGAIEQKVLEALRAARAGAPARLIKHELGYDLGMCCGGRMEVFIEPIEPRPRLFILGAGHVAQPTAEIAQRVGFQITVVDEREELLTEKRFPGCRLVLNSPRSALADLALTASDWVLIVTHDHELDERALERAARLPHRYIGLIASRRKVLRILQRLHARCGLPVLDKVYAPVGLDIGAETPEEIAVSVVAELVAIRRGCSHRHLRAIDDPRLKALIANGQTTDEPVVG